MPEQTLAQRVRAKHPGAYDDMNDAQLEAAVVAKFPGTYDDIPKTSMASHGPRSMTDRIGDSLESAARTVEDFVVGGIGKGVARSAYGAARIAAKPLPGENPLPANPKVLEPRNTAERVGMGVEQAAEFFIPGLATAKIPKALTKARAAAEALGAAGVATVQGGNPVTAAAGGAAGPLVGKAMASLPPVLRTAAEKKVVQALGPTKERFKAMANRLAPQMLSRGLGGSRESLLAQSVDKASEAGDLIDDALVKYGAKAVDTTPVVQALETAKDAFRTTNLQGATVVFEPRAVKQLEGLQQIVSDLGPNASVDQLVAVRRAWDKVVDQAGGFAHRAGGAIGIPLKEQTEAWAKREASGAIRTLLATEVPELAAVNKEFAFWKQLQDVLTQTLQRSQPQQGGLKKAAAEIAGAAAGSPQGLGTAWVTGKVAAMAQQAFTSPRWRLVDAKLRNQLADAIASGNTQRATTTLSRITAYLGSHAGRMPSPMASH